MNGDAEERFAKIRRIFALKFSQIHWGVHGIFPGLIPCPYKNSAFDNERDVKFNSSTRVLDGDELRLTCVWAAEIYGPSEIDSFYQGMRKFGWDVAEAGISDHDPVAWVQDQRMYGLGGSFHIGPVGRDSQKSVFTPRNFFAPIPDSFKFLDVSIYQITRSLTCVVVGFVLNDQSTKRYEEEINLDRKTYAKKHKGQRGYSIYDVRIAKREAANQVRRKYRDEACLWLNMHFPGFFARNAGGNQFPSMELLVTTPDRAFPERERRGDAPSWLRFLSLDYARELWCSKTTPGLKVSLDQLENDLRFHVISTFFRENSKYFRKELQKISDNDELLTTHLSGPLKEIFVHHSLRCLLREIRKNLSQFNEQIRFADRGLKSKKTLLQNLKRMEDFFCGKY